MKIVTGYTGQPHITSNDDQAKNQGMFGNGNSVLNVGNCFDDVLVDATTISISDGEGMIQGVHFRVEPGSMDTINLSPGVVGVNRIDLICARYTKDSATGIESVKWHVIEGTPAASPETPTYSTGEVLEGALEVDYPLYKVTFTGVTPVVEKMFRVLGKLYSIELDLEGTAGVDGVTTSLALESGMYYFSGMCTFNGSTYQQTGYFEMYISSHDGSYGGFNKISAREYTEDHGNRGQISVNGLIPVGMPTDTADGTVGNTASITVRTTAMVGAIGAVVSLRMMRIR